MKSELSRLVEKHGGTPLCVPAVGEKPVLTLEAIARFMDDLEEGGRDVVIFMTGVAVSLLFEAADQLGRRAELVTALKRATTICRGPKPTAALRGFGVPPTISAREPFTAAELIDAFADLEVVGRRVVLFNYGERSETLSETLLARQADLREIWLYKWTVPADSAPLEALVRSIIAGEVTALAVTCQIQFRNLYQVAERIDLGRELVRALNDRVVVGAVGPTCRAILEAYGVEPKVTPEYPKMGPLVTALMRYLDLKAQHAGARRDRIGVKGVLLCSVLALSTSVTPAMADEAAAPVPAPAPAPYSLPFQLRPALPGNAVRLDTSLAFYEDPKTHDAGTTTTPFLLFSYKVTDSFAPLIRIGAVQNSPPAGDGSSAFGLLNPAVGGTYGFKPIPSLRIGLFLGVTIPVGLGGGDHPNAASALARSVGLYARSAMDNAMFAVNDLTIFPGVDVAYVAGGFTAQAEATLLQLTRVRGADSQPDAHRTNFTAGVHVGYFIIPMLSLGAELRHQRWLSTPKAVAADKTGTLRDNTTVAFGPRMHFEVAPGKWLHPGISLTLPLDDPMKKNSYKIVQLDIPFSF